MIDRRSDTKLAGLVDAAAGSCRKRDVFWFDLGARGFDYALNRLIASGSIEFWVPKVQERYQELTSDGGWKQTNLGESDVKC